MFISKWGYLLGTLSIAVDTSDNIYVLDGSHIQKFDSDGIFLDMWSASGIGENQYLSAIAIAVDSSGDVYIVDALGNKILKFTNDGNFITKWGYQGTGKGQFYIPQAIALDPLGYVYIADYGNGRIQKFTSNGTFITKWSVGQFFYPVGIATDITGNVYVVDPVSNRIQKFNSIGTFITSWDAQDTGSRPFEGLRYIAVDSLGNVYVTENGGYYIQKFAPSSCTSPIKPVLLSPLNGSTGVSTSLTLDWGNVFGATSYKVQVCTDSSCLSMVRTATTTDSEWTVTPPLSPVKPPYYWRVKAINTCGSGPLSSIRSFTTACPTLDVPSLISPSNGTIGVPVSPTLDWDDVSGATSYRVQVCSDSSCLSIVASATASNSQWTVSPALSPSRTYYWRVKAKNSCGSSSWSEVWKFKTKPTITVTSPNGSENWQAGTIQTISWTYTGKPGSYVKIELFKAGILKSTIKASKPIGSNGSGYHNWAIPVNQEAGCDYQIKITSTTNSNVADKSDKPFCISQ